MGSAQTRNPLKRVDLNFKFIKLKLQVFTYFYNSLLRLYTKCWGKERAYKINLKNFQKK